MMGHAGAGVSKPRQDKKPEAGQGCYMAAALYAGNPGIPREPRLANCRGGFPWTPRLLRVSMHIRRQARQGLRLSHRKCEVSDRLPSHERPSEK